MNSCVRVLKQIIESDIDTPQEKLRMFFFKCLTSFSAS